MKLIPILLAWALTTFVAAEEDAGPSGVFVLGIDGMDPVILQRLMDEGRMPHFSRLVTEGSFQPLGTSNPPQSPVAWSNFVTGMNPGGHGVFDFIHRDPHSYQPVSSATRAMKEDPPGALNFFGYHIPLGGEEPQNNRSGTPWWDYLTEAGVETEVYRMPGNYPPTPSDAYTLSGMGTVDMRGDFGTYSWWTNEPILDTREIKADLALITVDDTDLDGVPDTVTDVLKGPPDILAIDPENLPDKTPHLTVPLTVHLAPEKEEVWLRCGDAQAILKEGEWSDWLEVVFDAAPGGLMPLSGTVRFYMKEVRPTFRLYASPVNIAPSAPAQLITTPETWAEDLHGEIGHFYTQGMPEETNALKDGLFDDNDYLAQVALVHEDGREMLDLALDRFERGDATFFYLSEIDLQCHMLWRHGDPKDSSAPPHPAHEPATALHHRDDIQHFYEEVDAVLGAVRNQLPSDTLLIVMSDHGFQPYHRAFHLNAWLVEEGYLVLRDGKTEGSILTDTDWSKTRAYALGFNGLYLNQRGRESEGIVSPEQSPSLLAEIASKLKSYQDPKHNAPAIQQAWTRDEVYSGLRLSESPDLVIGYDAGYGCSDLSTLGGVPGVVIEDNTSRWSGNHLMAPDVVPGILLVNRKITGSDFDLTDLTATLLDLYGLGQGEGMVGKAIPLSK